MNHRDVANRLWTGSGLVVGRLTRRLGNAGTAAKIGAGIIAWKAAPAIIEQTHRGPYLLPILSAGWVWAAWSASDPNKIDNPSLDPTPTDPDNALTSTGSGTEEAAGGGGEGFTIIDDPANPARSIVIHKETA